MATLRNKIKKKKKNWQLIHHVASNVGSKWPCIGDLNDTLALEDKKGDLTRSQTQLGLGRQVVVDCNLQDMGFEGYPYTWSNGREGEGNIQCRLDRALATADFLNRFSPTRVIHLPRFGSDHAALMVLLEAQNQTIRRKKIHLFRFEECWTKDDRCEEEVSKAWFSSENHCVAKLEAMKGLDKFLKITRWGL